MYVKCRDKCLDGHSHDAYEHWSQRLKYPFPPLSVLITVLWPWENTMIKIIKSENYLLGVLLTSYSMIIMVGSRLARRQTWNSSSNWEFISDLQVAGRDRCGVWWGGGRKGNVEVERERIKETERQSLGLVWPFETTKPTASDTPPSTRLHLLQKKKKKNSTPSNPSLVAPINGDQPFKHELMGAAFILTTTLSILYTQSRSLTKTRAVGLANQFPPEIPYHSFPGRGLKAGHHACLAFA